MNSSLIGKIEKANRYANEKERVNIHQIKVSLLGDHSTHEVSYESGKWICTCDFFSGYGVCSHTMALQKILDGMILVKEQTEA